MPAAAPSELFVLVTDDGDRTSDGDFPSWAFGPADPSEARRAARLINIANRHSGVWHARTARTAGRSAQVLPLADAPAQLLAGEPMSHAQWRSGQWDTAATLT